MRVLHVVEVSHGGVVSYARELIGEQVRRGYDVHVLAPPGSLAPPSVFCHGWQVDRRRPQEYAWHVRQVRKTVRDVRPDVVHLHSFWPGVYGRIAFLRSRTAPRLVYQPHAWAFHAVRMPLLRAAVVSWERFAARRAGAAACVSAGEMDEGRREGIPVHDVAVGSPVDVDHFHLVDDDTRKKWRAELGVHKPRVIVCVGRLCRQKGQDRLLDAWVRDPVPDAELVLVGPGDPRPLIDKGGDHWGSTVRAVGGQEDVRPWLWAADLTVLASRYEANSLAAGEAMACGRPVLTTEVAGAREAVGGMPAAGCVVPQNRVGMLLDECRRRFAEPEIISVEGKNARQRAVKFFGVAAVADRFEHLYSRRQAGYVIVESR